MVANCYWTFSACPRLPRRWSLALGLGLAQALLLSLPGWSAERVLVSYGVLERSVTLAELEAFARDGSLSRTLAFYARFFTPEELAQMRAFLSQRADVGVVAVSRFLDTPQGEYLLEQLGDVVQTGARQPGAQPSRAALVLAAADPEEGLTLLNVMRQFPTSTIRLDIERGLAIARGIDQAINQANLALTQVNQQAELEAAAEPIPNGVVIPTLRSVGPYAWERFTLPLTSERALADLYVPTPSENAASRVFPAPVVVISHGLGSDRTTFAYLARYLSSHGFAVLSMEHPGSSAARLQALFTGQAGLVVPENEFAQRPLDVRLALDVLERLNQSSPILQGRLDVNNVGVLGQSFGGYTSLALAGAIPNAQTLAANCPPPNLFNLSLLLQCQPGSLLNYSQELADPRIRAAIAINPIGSTTFGQAGFSQIQVPLMMVASSADTVAPALPEQLEPFTWLTHPDRYLLLLNRGTHFSTIGQSETNSETLGIPANVIGPNPAVSQTYMEVMSLAFFEVYLRDNPAYRPILTSAYAQQISQPTTPLSLVRNLTLPPTLAPTARGN